MLKIRLFEKKLLSLNIKTISYYNDYEKRF